MSYTLKEINKKFYNGDYDENSPWPELIQEGTFLDENKSVIWNREEVASRNEIILQQQQEISSRQEELNRQMVNDVLETIVKEYGMNTHEAVVIWEHVYQEYHATMSDVFNAIPKLVNFVENLS